MSNTTRSPSSPYSPITIVTVVFNGGEFLEETILSVVQQNRGHVDFIIIDGGSTDNTIEIIKKYEDKIAFWVSEYDKGIYDAMNKGWEKANINSHVLFLGAGDKILKLPEAELKPDEIYYGNVSLGDRGIFNAKAGTRLKIGNTVHHQALLIPKLLCATGPFNIAYKVYADFDFNQILLKRGIKFNKIDDLYAYVSPGGFSQQYATYEWLKIVFKNFGVIYSVLAFLYHYLYKFKHWIL